MSVKVGRTGQWVARLRRAFRELPREIRFAAAAAALALATLPVASGVLALVPLGCGLAAELLLLGCAAQWAWKHPGALFAARGALFRTSLIVTPAAVLGLEFLILQRLRAFVPVTPRFLVETAVSAFELLLLGTVATGIVGVAVAGGIRRSERLADGVAMAAALAASLPLITIVLMSLEAGPPLLIFGLMGAPLAAVAGLGLYAACARLAALGARSPLGKVGPWLRLRLPGKSRRVLDLRGAVLGAMVAGLVHGLSATDAFYALQVGLLGQLVAAGNQGHTRYVNRLRFLQAPGAPEIVIVTIDRADVGPRGAARSEPALDAALIRRLSDWGALRVVIPFPNLARQEKAGYQDVPELCRAMRESGNVIVASSGDLAFRVPRGVNATLQQPYAAWQQVAGVAAARGNYVADEWLEASTLPVLPTRWSHTPPAAFLLTAAVMGKPLGPPRAAGGSRVEVAGKRVPLVSPEFILVHMGYLKPENEFRHLACSHVLDGNSTPVLYKPRPGAWETTRHVPPQEFWRGKIVLVSPWWQFQPETAAGKMTVSELLALQTHTLLSDRQVCRLPAGQALLLALLLSVGIGTLGLHRGPGECAWYLAAGAGGVLAWTLQSYFYHGLWIDPVAPLLAAGLTTLLTTQLTFRHEREERERNQALLQSLVSRQVADELLDSTAARPVLGGRRQEVCVLFADTRGFTRFVEQAEPEAVVETINAYMAALVEVLLAHGGRLDKYTGDGLMALFPVGESRALDVRQAVTCAVEMQRAASRVSAERAACGHTPLELGIGLHVGEAVVGFVGHADQCSYTALGRTVVVAARLQTLAAGGEVVVSEAVADLVGRFFYVEERPPIPVKGLAEPIRPFCLSA